MRIIINMNFLNLGLFSRLVRPRFLGVLAFLQIAIVFVSFSSGAHEHHEVTVEQLTQGYEKAFEVFQSAFDPRLPEEGDDQVWLELEGQRVMFSQSRIAQAVALVIRQIQETDPVLCTAFRSEAQQMGPQESTSSGVLELLGACFEPPEALHLRVLKWVKSWIGHMSQFFVKSTRWMGSVLTGDYTLENFKKDLFYGGTPILGSAVRVLSRFGQAWGFAVIVSQVSWEAFESIVMAGAHWACTLFNSALLSTVLVARQGQNIVCASVDGMLLSERVKVAAVALKWNFYSVFRLKTLRSGNQKKWTAGQWKDEDVFSEFANESGLLLASFAARTLKSQDSSASGLNVRALEDFETLVSRHRHPTERRWVAFSIGASIKWLLEMLSTRMTKEFSEGKIHFFQYMKLSSDLGGIDRLLDRFSGQLQILASHPDASRFQQGMESAYGDILSLLHSFVLVLEGQLTRDDFKSQQVLLAESLKKVLKSGVCSQILLAQSKQRSHGSSDAWGSE